MPGVLLRLPLASYPQPVVVSPVALNPVMRPTASWPTVSGSATSN